VGLMATFYCLRFQTPPTWRARSPYLYPSGTRRQGCTPRHWVPFLSPPMTHRAMVEVFDPPPNSRTDLSRAEQSSSLLPATSQHGHSRHRAPLGPICSVSRHLFFFPFIDPPLIKREGLGFFYNWCSLTTPYSTRGHIKAGDIYIFTKHKLTLSSTTY
jgi:hypothetical protein